MPEFPDPELERDLQQFIQRERLPAGYLDAVTDCGLPLADDIAGRVQRAGRLLVVGIQGGQGTGKSTLASVLALLLEQQHGLRVAQLSIDDIYLTRAERKKLACQVHPLLATRGVPGSHDVSLARDILARLRRAGEGDRVALPRFDKALDDRVDRAQWGAVDGPVDVLLFEGWCVGASAAPPSSLAEPVNALEASNDGDGRWRGYVNEQLAGPYAELFAELDYLVTLVAPSFECMLRWRALQEQKLAARSDGPGVMDDTQLELFMQHYERITRRCLCELPNRADCVLCLDEDHRLSLESFPW